MNVQQTIISGIKELLFVHDYLVIPNFGGFVLKSTSSHFSNSKTQIFPPSKILSFNSQLKQDDGVLTTWLQTKIKCSLPESKIHLFEFSDYCSSILSTKRRLSIEEIGFFYLDFENNLCFEPQLISNFLKSSFGLGSIQISEILKQEIEVKKENTFVDRLIPPETNFIKQNKKRNYSKFVLPSVLVFLILVMFTFFISNHRLNGNLKSSIFGTTVKANYTPINYSNLNLLEKINSTIAYVADANGISSIELDKNKIIIVNVTETVLKPDAVSVSNSKSSTKINSKANFKIVLGCFTRLDNATKMVKKLSLKNVISSISKKNNKGMFVVSNGEFESKEDAKIKLLEIKNEFPNAWIKSEN